MSLIILVYFSDLPPLLLVPLLAFMGGSFWIGLDWVEYIGQYPSLHKIKRLRG